MEQVLYKLGLCRKPVLQVATHLFRDLNGDITCSDPLDQHCRKMVNRLLQGNILNVITADEEQLADGLGIILPATDILENEKSGEHECSCAVGYVVAGVLETPCQA